MTIQTLIPIIDNYKKVLAYNI